MSDTPRSKTSQFISTAILIIVVVYFAGKFYGWDKPPLSQIKSIWNRVVDTADSALNPVPSVPELYDAMDQIDLALQSLAKEVSAFDENAYVVASLESQKEKIQAKYHPIIHKHRKVLLAFSKRYVEENLNTDQFNDFWYEMDYQALSVLIDSRHGNGYLNTSRYNPYNSKVFWRLGLNEYGYLTRCQEVFSTAKAALEKYAIYFQK